MYITPPRTTHTSIHNEAATEHYRNRKTGQADRYEHIIEAHFARRPSLYAERFAETC